jgi:hypothetical protein
MRKINFIDSADFEFKQERWKEHEKEVNYI